MDIYSAVRISLPLALAACGGYMPPTPVEDSGLPPDAQTIPADAPTDPVDALPPFDAQPIPFDSGIQACPPAASTPCSAEIYCVNDHAVWECNPAVGHYALVECQPADTEPCKTVCADYPKSWCSP